MHGGFFECLPDDPLLCAGPERLRQNAARLRFYERFGARPIRGTCYETPLEPGGDCPPYLVFDDLGTGKPLRKKTARHIVNAILEKKYGDICPPEYRRMVVESFIDDPVRLRQPRYKTGKTPPGPDGEVPPDEMIALVVNEGHAIHHVRERGYVESPARVDAILAHLERTGLFLRVAARKHGESAITAVHDKGFFEYLKRVCKGLSEKETVYPYVFPIRNNARPPRELPLRAGYYCIDTFTPLSMSAFMAARTGVDCTLTAADCLIHGRRLAYALVRPPGHHAESRAFGGFCYFNNAAIAARHMSRYGRVAILDLDYHHGNGQQQIFWERSEVLTVSIHCHPAFAYPYFSGFSDEKGAGEGLGYNVNIPMPESLDGQRYAAALDKALRKIGRFAPDFLVVALGLDTSKKDPTGSWDLTPGDFRDNGRKVGRLKLPVLVVQEGGYNTRMMGPCAAGFSRGLREGGLHD